MLVLDIGQPEILLHLKQVITLFINYLDVVPCLILIVMAVPSFKILYEQDEIPPADVTIKAVGVSGIGAMNILMKI